MRAFKKKNVVFSIKLADDLFSLAQTVNPKSTIIRLFAIFNNKDEWSGIDLNNIDTLCCVYAGNILMQKLGVRKISESEVKIKTSSCKHYFINPGDNAEGYRLRDEFIWKGGSLVDVGEDLEDSYLFAPVVIEELSVKEHLEQILTYEFVNMYGAVDTVERLVQFYNTGINKDQLKEKIFPELENTEVIPKANITKLF